MPDESLETDDPRVKRAVLADLVARNAAEYKASGCGPGKMATFSTSGDEEADRLARQTPCSYCGQPLGAPEEGKPTLQAKDGVLIAAYCAECNLTALRERIVDLPSVRDDDPLPTTTAAGGGPLIPVLVAGVGRLPMALYPEAPAQ